MIEWVKIGNREFKAIVEEVSENFNILYSENTGRTLEAGAPMTLDPLGTFFGHKITFGRKQGFEKDYDALFNYVSIPRYDGIAVTVPHGQSTLSYTAYISQGERSLKRIDERTGKVYWDKFTLNIVPMKAQVLPE